MRRRAEQLRLPLPRQRKALDTDTQAKRARDLPESKRYDQILDAMLKHPQMAIAWNSTFSGVGFFTPRGQAAFRRFIKSGMPGLTDLSGLTKFGRPAFIEVKVEGGTVSDVQQDFHDLVAAVDGVLAVVHSASETWDALEEQTSFEATLAWHYRNEAKLKKWAKQLNRSMTL